MVCSKCGKENKEAAIWCGECGAKLFVGRTDYICREATEQNASPKDQLSKNVAFEISTPEKTYCAGCGKERKETDEFCGGCGKTLFINVHAGAVAPSNDENHIILPRICKDNQDIVADNTTEEISFKGLAQINTGNIKPIEIIYLLIIVIPLIFAAFMLFGAIGDGEKALNSNPQIVMAEQKLREIENDINIAKAWVTEKEKEIKQELSTLVDPGPEPKWWQLIERPIWVKKKAAYDFANKKIEIAKAELKNKVEALKGLQYTKALSISWIESTKRQGSTLLKYVWNTYLRPVLHFFLIWSIFVFSLKCFCRFLLIKNWLGVTKL